MRRSRALFVLLAAVALSSCAAARAPSEQEARIASLEAERTALRQRVDDLVAQDPAALAMPGGRVRLGIPTALAQDLISRVTTGFVGQLSLELTGLHVRKSGTVRRFVTLGDYDLDVAIERLTAHLRTSKPEVLFGKNMVSLAVPVRVASGDGRALVHFQWTGRSVAGTVCGDLDITREVSGSVAPRTYPVRGSLLLSATSREIVATPRFPELVLMLNVTPSTESWAAMKAVLDEKEGVCGFVLDRLDVLGMVKAVIDRGFSVRLPTERLRPMAVPVGLASSLTVRGRLITMDLKVTGLAITQSAIWLAADAGIEPGGAP